MQRLRRVPRRRHQTRRSASGGPRRKVTRAAASAAERTQPHLDLQAQASGRGLPVLVSTWALSAGSLRMTSTMALKCLNLRRALKALTAQTARSAAVMRAMTTKRPQCSGPGAGRVASARVTAWAQASETSPRWDRRQRSPRRPRKRGTMGLVWSTESSRSSSSATMAEMEITISVNDRRPMGLGAIATSSPQTISKSTAQNSWTDATAWRYGTSIDTSMPDAATAARMTRYFEYIA
mmetsp:Transcript_1159/g.2904  ORF Transcript_1159/g.2904 Transcript_1159/m.2904 type:complete len:237 (-) Transcript_1159:8-718(-)